MIPLPPFPQWLRPCEAMKKIATMMKYLIILDNVAIKLKLFKLKVFYSKLKVFYSKEETNLISH